jgi:hypothetical protein
VTWGAKCAAISVFKVDLCEVLLNRRRRNCVRTVMMERIRTQLCSLSQRVQTYLNEKHVSTR